MGGPKKEDMQAQRDYARDNRDIMAMQVQASKEDKARRDELMKPAYDFNLQLAKGDTDSIMSTLAVPMGQISKQSDQTRGRIMDMVPAGAARDYAIAKGEQEKGQTIASFMAGTQAQAMDKVANMGAGYGSFSLQSLGAGMAAGQQASAATNAVMQADQAKKASTMGLLGSVAQAGGQIATGGFSGMGKGASQAGG